MRNSWHLLFFLSCSFHFSSSQGSRFEKTQSILEEEDPVGYRLKGRRVLDASVSEIIESSGERVWKGWGNEETLSIIGVTHEANQRNLQGSHNYYSIGSYSGRMKQGKKAKSSKKSSKSSSSAKSPSHPSRPSHPTPPTPNIRPTPHPPSPPSPSPPGGGCKTRVNVDFLQFSAIPPALVNDPSNPDVQSPGTRYVYNDGLRDQETIDELQGSRATGTCTRTQSRIGDPGIGLQLGSGHCVFTYTLFDGNREITFSASGDLTDALGGTLSITGGTKSGKAFQSLSHALCQEQRCFEFLIFCLYFQF